MKTIKTSVAIAAYRGRRFLEEQIASIARQSHPLDEVVVADDCSDDGTADFAEELLTKYGLHGKVLRSPRNVGVAANFERAIRACSGEIVFLSDQDDVWCPDKAHRILHTLESRPALQAIFTDAVVVDANRNKIHPSLLALSRLTARERARIHEGAAFDVLMTRNVATGATMAVRAASMQGLFPVPPSWYHDEWIAINLSTDGKLDLVDEALIEYRQHGRNAIGAPRLTGLRDKLRSLSKPSRAERRHIARRAEEFAERICARPEFDARARAAADEKCRHLRARAELPNSILARVPLIFREFVFGHYSKYSHGIRAALRDVLQALD